VVDVVFVMLFGGIFLIFYFRVFLFCLWLVLRLILICLVWRRVFLWGLSGLVWGFFSRLLAVECLLFFGFFWFAFFMLYVWCFVFRVWCRGLVGVKVFQDLLMEFFCFCLFVLRRISDLFCFDCVLRVFCFWCF